VLEIIAAQDDMAAEEWCRANGIGWDARNPQWGFVLMARVVVDEAAEAAKKSPLD
jgi:hypothetical protein